MSGKQLQKVSIEKEEYFLNPSASLPDKLPQKIHLLPIYDEYIMGYQDRSAIMILRNNAPFRYDSMIILDGQVIGTWRRTILKNSIDLEVDFFTQLSKQQRALLDEAVHRLSEFMELKVNKK